MFFFAKKNQKTFASLAHASRWGRDSETKVFCFFSSEKKTLLFYRNAFNIGTNGRSAAGIS